MSETISVAEYCKRHNTSTQAVYARIKRGTLESTVVNGLKMVIDENIDNNQSTVADNNNEFTMLLQSIIKQQKKEIKRLHKTIKRLEDERFKSVDALIEVLSGNGKLLLPNNEDIIDVVPKKKKKKKKKK